MSYNVVMGYAYIIKSCGKAHNYCLVCRPDLADKQARAAIAGGLTRKNRPHSPVTIEAIRIGRLRIVEREYSSRIEEWLNGRVYTAINGFIRRYLFEQKGECCWDCGWCKKHPITGRVMVQIHHIDGNKRNNILENLKVLCPNCHSLTDTFLNTKRRRAEVSSLVS